ncbi:DNA mismatch repair protein MSH4 isoform X1 [Amborella trichopoda]|uniref:DNA mismatch repair protein MSH4 isoform X1 n=2 Tax=Amborella trichopoda TaxID=13333 RepID=UPI0009C0159E|nr:DNA mismatch repair protein MSH4 isoform X1 [Amborella trichopoda]|eukprot:XP_020519239.1 DNA mismatch repair protein MSH4 isoform X1 [Amborella trichopoda]
MEEGNADISSYIVGLIENRAKEVGLVAFNLRSASLHLSQYIETSSSYQNTKTLLHFYDPVAIIVPPNKFAPDGRIGVSELVDRYYSSTKKVVMARGCFDDTKGSAVVKNLASHELSVLGLDTYYKQYYLCLGAAAATIKWTETDKGVIVTNHSISVTFNGSFDHMNIDVTSVECSIQNLEVIEPLDSILGASSNKKKSLFYMLKTTKTIGGTRLLRANLLQPLKDIETINARLDCLDELMSNEELFFGLSQVLRKFPKETDRVLCHFCFKPNRVTTDAAGLVNARKSQMLIATVILLKTALDALPLLSKALKDSKCFLLRNIYNICGNEKYDAIRKRIRDYIDEDILHARVPFVARTQQCFAVKAGIDGFLDVARRSFCDTSEAIHDLAKRYREDYQLPNLKMPFNNRQGFYFSLPQKDIKGLLPGIFIQILKHGKNIHCSTQELESLNVRNKSAAAECYTRTELCLEGLVNSIREDASVLTLLAETLCLLDMILNSFAHTISTKPVDRYTRPEFTENGPIAIDAGRHPILENVQNEFTPNNIFLSEASNMVIVMGPNMSGKSTYLQQVCLVVILAHIGCYVPAHFSSLRVVDRIFTRIGTGDNLESNSSTFMTEMKETAFIMQNVSPRSLIVMDELGRATSSSDGFAIAWSCCEHLLSLNAYTIFATHMENLSELASVYPNVKILHFQVDIKDSCLDFKFHLRDGPQQVNHYGLLLAGVAGLPGSVVKTAQSITARIAEKEATKMELNCTQYHSIRMDYRVAQRLICLRYSNQDKDCIRQALKDLKQSYIDGKLI